VYARFWGAPFFFQKKAAKKRRGHVSAPASVSLAASNKKRPGHPSATVRTPDLLLEPILLHRPDQLGPPPGDSESPSGATSLQESFLNGTFGKLDQQFHQPPNFHDFFAVSAFIESDYRAHFDPIKTVPIFLPKCRKAFRSKNGPVYYYGSFKKKYSEI
jgi:hypothetical protein